MLDDTRRQRLRELFADGVELPPGQRPAFVAQACADDAALRVELLGMLEVPAARVDEFLTRPAVPLPQFDATSLAGPETEGMSTSN